LIQPKPVYLNGVRIGDAGTWFEVAAVGHLALTSKYRTPDFSFQDQGRWYPTELQAGYFSATLCRRTSLLFADTTGTLFPGAAESIVKHEPSIPQAC
jgi:hypothetical protein